MKKFITICCTVLACFAVQSFAQIPTTVLVQIVKAEDERRYDKTLEDLMKNGNEKIRARAALACGRIGDERAVLMLAGLLDNGSDAIRATAAFAVGEIESIKAADAILKILSDEKVTPEVRARAVEAAGKIAAANAKDEKSKELGEAILDVLDAETKKPKADKLTVLFGLTAVLRAKPEEGDFVAAKFLTSIDPRIRADAANTLSRLRAKNANEQFRAMLLADDDAIVRANAARALGAAEDKDAFNLLLESAASDEDSRVRVSAIRSLGNLKDKKAADKLLERGETLLADYKKSKFANPIEKNELLEITTALGNLLKNTDNERAVEFLTAYGLKENFISPEIHIAFAKISPSKFIDLHYPNDICSVNSINVYTLCWQFFSSYYQGLSELANLEEKNALRSKAENILIRNLGFDEKSEFSTDSDKRYVPDELRTLSKFNPKNTEEILRSFLDYRDIFVRATAAELLADQPATKESIEALQTAFVQALEKDREYNDAQLAILSALVKLDKAQVVSSLKLALDAPDYLVRRHAANLIKQNDLSKDFPNAENKVGTVKSYNPKTGTKLGQVLNTNADYVRAVSRKSAKAILTTEKGTFTIEFFPADAPLTVDNFIKLARKNYFNGLAIHRVVPNFVMQDGDPRGDGNGSPGWEIRDEINMIPYERGAVGMALSGKDTGGSQWFVTHSPQPHLDGGYTVFGRVNETDMKIVDNLVRGDKILTVKIVEGNLLQRTQKTRKKIR